jgi:hypothetical protein
MYIRLTNGQPETYTIGQFRRDNPDTSFPKDIPAETLAQFGVYPVKELPRPDYDPQTHYLKQSDFYQVDGKWQVHYSPAPLPESQAAENIRAERDQRLAQTDWMMLPDSGRDTQELRDYRAALREVPQQDAFPYSVVWPEEPIGGQ